MNLHSVVQGAISSINPTRIGTVQIYCGQESKPGGIREPKYRTCTKVPMQIQPLTADDIKLIDSLNIQSVKYTIFLNGHLDGLVRSQDKGGDLITLLDGPNAGVYKVVQVIESWPDWCRCAVALQNVT